MYFILKCFSPANGHIARIEYKKDNPFRFWNLGRRFANPPTVPIAVRVLTDSQSVLPELWETPLPMMSRKLYDSLIGLGVGNLDAYSVVLIDSTSGEHIDRYVAFNLIDIIAAPIWRRQCLCKGMLIG